MSNKVGVVMLPMIFGFSESFREHARILRGSDFEVEAVDLYKFQSFKRRHFLTTVIGNGKKKLTELAMRFNDNKVLSEIDINIGFLKIRGCGKIALLGFGMGAIYALWFAERCSTPAKEVQFIGGWYPHLIFPPESKKTPPDLSKISCPTMLFYGDHDKQIEPGTIELAEKHSCSGPLQVQVFDRVGHAFADRYVQGSFPNPHYDRRCANLSFQIAMENLYRLRYGPA